MVDKELLAAIGDLLEEKLEKKLEEKLEKKLNEKFEERLAPINKRLSILEIKHDMTHKKLDNLEFSTKSMERAIRTEIVYPKVY